MPKYIRRWRQRRRLRWCCCTVRPSHLLATLLSYDHTMSHMRFAGNRLHKFSVYWIQCTLNRNHLMLNMTLPCMQMTENFQCCHLHTTHSDLRASESEYLLNTEYGNILRIPTLRNVVHNMWILNCCCFPFVRLLFLFIRRVLCGTCER